LSKTLQLAGREVRFVRIGGVWQSILDEPTTPDWVLKLPDGVLVAELFERNVSIFWDERSGLEGLDQLNQAIESIG